MWHSNRLQNSRSAHIITTEFLLNKEKENKKTRKRECEMFVYSIVCFENEAHFSCKCVAFIYLFIWLGCLHFEYSQGSNSFRTIFFFFSLLTNSLVTSTKKCCKSIACVRRSRHFTIWFKLWATTRKKTFLDFVHFSIWLNYHMFIAVDVCVCVCAKQTVFFLTCLKSM